MKTFEVQTSSNSNSSTSVALMLVLCCYRRSPRYRWSHTSQAMSTPWCQAATCTAAVSSSACLPWAWCTHSDLWVLAGSIHRGQHWTTNLKMPNSSVSTGPGPGLLLSNIASVRSRNIFCSRLGPSTENNRAYAHVNHTSHQPQTNTVTGVTASIRWILIDILIDWFILFVFLC